MCTIYLLKACMFTLLIPQQLSLSFLSTTIRKEQTNINFLSRHAMIAWDIWAYIYTCTCLGRSGNKMAEEP